MPFTTLAHKALLGYEMGDTNPTIPANHFLGLIIAPVWTLTTVVATGSYVIPTTFSGLTGSIGRIFKATTGGTTSGTQPTWPTSLGGTVVDGSVTWTEVSNLFAAGTFTGVEPSGGGYARITVANNTTNWPVPSGTNPVTVQNGALLSWPQTTSSWGQIVGVVGFDAITAGNGRFWTPLTGAASTVATVVGVTPQLNINAFTLELGANLS